MAINKVKPQGHIALVLPTGHLSKGNATAKLREWMRSQVALKAVIPLDSDTFAESGVQGTGVGTVLCIWQKAVKQGKVFIGELSDKRILLQISMHLFINTDYLRVNNMILNTQMVLKVFMVN